MGCDRKIPRVISGPRGARALPEAHEGRRGPRQDRNCPGRPAAVTSISTSRRVMAPVFP